MINNECYANNCYTLTFPEFLCMFKKKNEFFQIFSICGWVYVFKSYNLMGKYELMAAFQKS